MANNNSITYWNSVKNTYSDSLPNPDVVTAPLFNDMNRGLMEYKWRNSVQRTLSNSAIYTAYGSTVPSGSVLMHECVDITFLDMDSTSDQRKHIVRFHLIKGNDEQIVTYRSTYDPLVGTSVINVDWGCDMFPITVQTANQQNGAPNKLKIEMQATSNNAEEFSYWIESNSPIETIFDAKNTARSTSSNSQWSNLANVIAGTLGNNKGMFADVYTGSTYGYQRKYYKLADTTWRFQTSPSTVATASMTANQQYGSILTVDNLNANSISTNGMTVINSLNVLGPTYLNTLNIANSTNDNIYVSNIYSNPTGGNINVRDGVLLHDGFLSFDNGQIVGDFFVSGTIDTDTLEADTIKCPSISSGISSGTSFVPVVFNSSISMGSYSVSTTGLMSFGKHRASQSATYTSSASPTSLSTSRILMNGYFTLDLRNCANTAGDMYYFCITRSSGGDSPSVLIKHPFNVGGAYGEANLSANGGGFIMLIGTGTTGVFYYPDDN